MRLTAQISEKICHAIGEVAHSNSLQIYLFGSRTDDSKLGGDIDLLVLCSSPEEKARLQDLKYRILGKIYAAIGEQKIDLLIAHDGELKTDLFLQQVFPRAKRLS